MRRVHRTSGDLLADRRYAYGEASAKAGDLVSAADLFEQALELAPGWTDAWFALGLARRDAGQPGRARAAFARCLALDPDDVLGAGLELARLGVGTLAAAPPAYVAALFDAYADDFDDALAGRLGYRAPQLVAAALADRRFARVLDLGCGTGLSGAALRPLSDYLEGVDLSDAMLARARSKEVYDALLRASFEERLDRDDGPFDLIAAVDVFAYLGDLGSTVQAAARRLAPGGLLAFTVEKSESEDWTLRPSRRFAHGEAYLRRRAADSGLVVEHLEDQALRRDRGEDIRGLIAVFGRVGP
ncbi:MAG: methyltransferase domain-containing protein [Parvularculaceae bacterium]|nr:methyltransferase domain-containing protein [Parvularculaceae bacterium]